MPKEITPKEKREKSIVETLSDRYHWKDVKLTQTDFGYIVEYQDMTLRVETIGDDYYTFDIQDVSIIERKMR